MTLTFVNDLSLWLGRQKSGWIDWIWPGYADLDSLFYGTLVLAPLFFILWTFRNTVVKRFRSSAAERTPDAIKSADAELENATSGHGDHPVPEQPIAIGFFQRIFGWTLRRETPENGHTK